jgi:tetratricopeptide (TPR) repeat protein
MPPADVEHAPAVTGPAPGDGDALHRARTRVAAWVLDPWLIPYALAAIALLAFSPALLNGFVEWDDHINLLENPSYRGLGWTHIRWMFTTTLMGHYIPVTWLSFGLDYTLWGMNPFGYHLTNNLIHAANTAVFYVVALRLLGKASTLTGGTLRAAGVMAALFFALHPLRAESVAWVTERRDVLSGLFFLLTILLYLAAADADGAARRRLLVGSVIAYALALLSKSIVMTLPLVLLLLDVYPLGRLPRSRGTWRETATAALLREKLPYLTLGFAGAVVSYWSVASQHFLTGSDKYGWPARVGIAAYSVWFYVEKTAVPLALSPLYELPRAVSLLEARFLWSTVAAVSISLALLALRRRWPGGLAVWIYYGIVIGPVSGIVHSGFQLTNDRYSYLSCLGLALIVGAAIGLMASAAGAGTVRPWLMRVAAVAAAAWILALGTLTWYQVQIWRNTETLWRNAVESDPECSICQHNVGVFYYQHKLYPLAKAKYELALALRPDRLRVHGNLGLVLHGMGDVDGALRHIRIALDDSPKDPKNLTSMAYVLLTQKRHAEAMPYLERAYAIAPTYVPGLVNLGLALSETGHPAEGLAHLTRALELKPDESMVHVGLARVHLARGDYEAAAREYAVLTTLDPAAAQALEPAFFSVW